MPDNRDPEIDDTINEIRNTVEQAQQSAKDQIDVTKEIDRLFLIYQAGGVIDQGKTNDTLMVARAAKKMDLDQFRNLATRVKKTQQKFDSRKQSGKYQAALWSLVKEHDQPEFSPDRNANNEPIGNDSLPDVSELLPKSFTEGALSPMATPLADMMRGQDAHPQQISNVDRLEKMMGKFGLRFPDFKSASFTGAAERELNSYQYHKLDVDDLAKNLAGSPQYASGALDIDPGLFVGGRNQLGQPKPDDNEARQWAEGIRSLHESRVAELAKKKGAQASSPVFAETKAQAKSYTQGAIESIQDSRIFGTGAPQEGTPGAPGAVGSPPVQTAENRATGGGKEGMSMLDWLQLGLDGAGVVEPTPFADLANAGISMGRAVFDPSNAGQHLKNAGISLASTIPYVGDIAKFAKGYGKGGKALGNTLKGLTGSGSGSAGGGGMGGVIGGVIGGLFGGGLGGGGGGSGAGGLTGSSGSGGLGGGGSGSFGTLAITTLGLIAGFKALTSWVIRTAESGQALIESQRNLAMYSGELSNAFAQYDTNAVMRDVRKADYLGSSASGLAAAQTRYQDAKAFRDAPGQRTANNMTGLITEVATIATYVQSFTSLRGLLERGFYAVVDATKSNSTAATSGAEELIQKMEANWAAEQAALAAKNNPPVKPAKPRLPADIPAELQQRINRLNIR